MKPGLHMIVKNEVDLLGKLLPYIKPWVAEMVIVDTGSTDGTQAFIQKCGGVVLEHPLDMDFGATRRFGLSQLTPAWALWLDADEWPERELLDWIAGVPEESLAQAISVHRHNLVGGQPIGRATHEWHVRVFRKGLPIIGRIHEHVIVDPRRVVFAPEAYLLRHYKTVDRQEEQNLRYMDWEEQRRIVAGV